MKKVYLKIMLVAVAIVGSQSFGAFFAVRLHPVFRYLKAERGCSMDDDQKCLTLTGQIKKGQIKEAHLRDAHISLFERIQLRDSELKGLTLQPVELGNYFVVNFPVSERLLKWMIRRINPICEPSAAITKMTPASHMYKFNQKDAIEFTTSKQHFTWIVILAV